MGRTDQTALKKRASNECNNVSLVGMGVGYETVDEHEQTKKNQPEFRFVYHEQSMQ